MRSDPTTCDVLVVGAGPTGLTAATVLARHGVDVLVIERHDGTSPFATDNVLRSLGRDPGLMGDGLAWDIGARYTSAVIEAGPGTGERAPHAWLRHSGSQVSTIDLFDGRLTVLTGPRGGPWLGWLPNSPLRGCRSWRCPPVATCTMRTVRSPGSTNWATRVPRSSAPTDISPGAVLGRSATP